MITYLLICQILGSRCEVLAVPPGGKIECERVVHGVEAASTMGHPPSIPTINGRPAAFYCLELPMAKSNTDRK